MSPLPWRSRVLSRRAVAIVDPLGNTRSFVLFSNCTPLPFFLEKWRSLPLRTDIVAGTLFPPVYHSIVSSSDAPFFFCKEGRDALGGASFRFLFPDGDFFFPPLLSFRDASLFEKLLFSAFFGVVYVVMLFPFAVREGFDVPLASSSSNLIRPLFLRETFSPR